jgi:hypothetical protein
LNKITVAAALIAFGFATSAQASSLGRPCTTAPESQWLSLDQLRAKAEAQGYTVGKAKIAKACGEFYAVDKTGKQVELFLDPTSGVVIGTK